MNGILTVMTIDRQLPLCFLFCSKPENCQIESHRGTKQQNILESNEISLILVESIFYLY